MSDVENPLEPFKAHNYRKTITPSLATMSWTWCLVPGRQLCGSMLRLPVPALGADQTETDAVRGVGDEFALRFRHHNACCMRAAAPRAVLHKKCLKWINCAGSRPLPAWWHVKGVAQNLDAHLEMQCKTSGF